jgi:predicted nucleotidyltransferase
MHPALAAHRPALAALCRRFGVIRLDVFGSAARAADFDAARSDADFLVEFAVEPAGLGQFLDFKEALEALLGRPVDLVERRAIEDSRNYIRRRHILAEAEAVYGAG